MEIIILIVGFVVLFLLWQILKQLVDISLNIEQINEDLFKHLSRIEYEIKHSIKKETNLNKSMPEGLVDFQDMQSLLEEEKGKIFSQPHFVDIQDAFGSMEVNYLRLKQRFSEKPEKLNEITRDWYKYIQSLVELIYARLVFECTSVDKRDEDFLKKIKNWNKESFVSLDRIEKEFKSLLGKDWQEIPHIESVS